MLKYILLATSVAIASPAFAQDAPPMPATAATQQTPPAADQSAPPPAESKQTAPTPDPQPATAAAQPAPTEPATTAEPATAEAAPAPGQPATGATQVAQVVSQEFGTYDKDASGSLDKAEFGSWMVALRKASQPTFQPDAPESKTWVAQAFTQADTDKNATVTQAELMTFLTPKPA